jgi:hypothetical protein
MILSKERKNGKNGHRFCTMFSLETSAFFISELGIACQ